MREDNLRLTFKMHSYFTSCAKNDFLFFWDQTKVGENNDKNFFLFLPPYLMVLFIIYLIQSVYMLYINGNIPFLFIPTDLRTYGVRHQVDRGNSIMTFLVKIQLKSIVSIQTNSFWLFANRINYIIDTMWP